MNESKFFPATENTEFTEALEKWIISKLVEGQRTGIIKMPSDFRVPERKPSCLQS
jgi:hypothetical protein